ncbi:hypothetical protein VTN31DRAFT_7289 [Thermomyces dupontii]|uniref:uncharacterized protein n=1 Tax=Talaromyces thermophilus TaxID=28565 RepID=UPI00374404A0
MGQTRAADDDPAPPTQTQAAKFNALALRKLQLAIRKNPEVDLTTHLPKDYSNRLTGMRAVTKEPRYKSPLQMAEGQEDTRLTLRASGDVEILFPLSESVNKLLGTVTTTADPLPGGLPQRLIDVLNTSEVIYKGPFSRKKKSLQMQCRYCRQG